MATRSLGSQRSALQRKISVANRALLEHVRQVTGADSDLMKAAGAALQKAIRKRLSTKGAEQRISPKATTRGKPRVYGKASAPGESPRLQRGELRRKIQNTVREGERAVVANDFRAHILEFGAVTKAEAARTSRLRNPGKKGKPGALRAHQHTVKAKAARVLAPRPFMRPGLEDARPALAKVGAQILREQGVPITMRQGAGARG